MRKPPEVNLHPSSVVYPQLPTVLGPNEGLAFGSILQTHMPPGTWLNAYATA